MSRSEVRAVFDGLQRCPTCGAEPNELVAHSYRGSTLASDSGPEIQCMCCGRVVSRAPNAPTPPPLLDELRQEGRHD